MKNLQAASYLFGARHIRLDVHSLCPDRAYKAMQKVLVTRSLQVPTKATCMCTGRKLPGSQNSLLVGVSMVVVVLDPPRLERVYERHERQCTHDVLNELILAEGSVPAVMANHKPLQEMAQLFTVWESLHDEP